MDEEFDHRHWEMPTPLQLAEEAYGRYAEAMEWVLVDRPDMLQQLMEGHCSREIIAELKTRREIPSNRPYRHQLDATIRLFEKRLDFLEQAASGR